MVTFHLHQRKIMVLNDTHLLHRIRVNQFHKLGNLLLKFASGGKIKRHALLILFAIYAEHVLDLLDVRMAVNLAEHLKITPAHFFSDGEKIAVFIHP